MIQKFDDMGINIQLKDMKAQVESSLDQILEIAPIRIRLTHIQIGRYGITTLPQGNHVYFLYINAPDEFNISKNIFRIRNQLLFYSILILNNHLSGPPLVMLKNSW